MSGKSTDHKHGWPSHPGHSEFGHRHPSRHFFEGSPRSGKGHLYRAFVVVLVCWVSGAVTARPKGLNQNGNPLAEELKSPDADIRARAARDLGKTGDPAVVPALRSALQDPSTKVRREAVVGLAEIHAEPSLEALITATRDPDPDVRVLAVEAVTGYYTGDVPKLGLAGFVRKNVTSHFQNDTRRIDPGVQVAPEVVSALETAMLDERSIEAAREAAQGLGILMAKAAVPDLVKAAHSSDEGLALEALNSLSKLMDISAGPKLVDLLDSPRKAVRQSAAVTVGILRTSAAAARLEQMYSADGDKKTRQAALEGLAYLGRPASYSLFIQALSSKDKTDRTSAAEGLARIRDPRAESNLETALSQEKDGGAKLAMDFALASLGNQNGFNDLVNGLRSTFRGDVASAYLTELFRDKPFLQKLYPYLDNPDATIRRRLCWVLMYTGDETSLKLLDRLSSDPNRDVAAAALRARRAILARASAPSA